MTKKRLAGLFFLVCGFGFTCTRARAADPFINILGGSAPVKDGLYYSIENSGASGNLTGPSILENRLRSANLLVKDGADTWGSQVTLGSFHFGSPITFPNTGLVLPSNFFDVEAGGIFKRTYELGRELAINLTLGSDSDIPFYSFAEAVFQSTALYRLPSSRTQGWVFLVNVTNNRSFLNYVPLPGVIYYYRALDGKASYSLGFPVLMASYELLNDLTVKASFIGISQASAEVSQKLGPSATIYAGYDWGQRTWLRVGRDDPLNRLFLDQQKVSVGLRLPLSAMLIMDLSGGYDFARSMFEAHSYYSAPEGVVGVDPAWTALLMVGLRQFSDHVTTN